LFFEYFIDDFILVNRLEIRVDEPIYIIKKVYFDVIIEEFFSQLKHYIKRESPNTYDDIVDVITNIINKKITKVHLTNYLKHSYKIYNS
jgi:hypothetical protein